MFVFKAAVVGAGTMGGEIAQAIAAAGFPVVLTDLDAARVDLGLAKARAVTAAQTDELVARGRLHPEAAGAAVDAIAGRIQGATGYGDFGDVDFVIEAVPERMAVKQAVFAELDAATPGHAVLASNTSSLSITEMADVTSRPDRVVGFHFFYPASASRVVEIVEGQDTSPGTLAAAASFAQAIRKTPIQCAEDPGFVVNRILTSAISELWRLQEEEGLDFEALDRAVTESQAAPTGPFLLTDLLGLDTVLHVAEHLRESYGERFHVHAGMQELVAAGDLGRKSGKGFYDHGA
jgi:3-hydroxyacyl-CoA dehydrogenase